MKITIFLFFYAFSLNAQIFEKCLNSARSVAGHHLSSNADLAQDLIQKNYPDLAPIKVAVIDSGFMNSKMNS